MSDRSAQDGRGAAGDAPIRYIDRTHAWYAALGYPAPYRYAHFADVPFARLRVPLPQARVGLITTAAPFRDGLGDQSIGAPYNAAAKFYAVYSLPIAEPVDLRVSHVAVDRRHAGNDMASWFPVDALRRANALGRIGSLGPRFHGVPTNRSQRHTQEFDAPEVVARCRDDGLDGAVLVPNCPVCHQSLAIVARHLEAAGIATVVLGAAKDIVEHCGVPRFVFSDFPLGNAAGPPFDTAGQDATLALALDLLGAATAPRTTVQNPLRWPGPLGWRRDYLNLAGLTAADIARERAANDAIKSVAQGVRDRTLAE